MEQTMSYIQAKDGALWLTEDERENLKISYRIKEIIHSEESPFQHVTILDSYDFGRMLVLDGVVQTTSMDGFIYNEMISHIPLRFHPNPKRVLIIGGGDCGAAREVAKYANVEQIDMVELDEIVVKVCKEHLTEVSGNLSDPRVHFIYNDGVAYVKNYENYYDIIIVDSSDPVGPAEQLFELDFYRNLHRALKDDGIMVCQSQSPVFHADIMGQTHRHIQSLFPVTKVYTAVVPTYPGGLWSFTMGSKIYDKPAENQPSGIETKYVNTNIIEACFQLPEFMIEKLRI
ncbi:polyamine aminopropyltransferase [Aneurinibacillus aneurinilyticus]|jgi:spermidine synthase|uniref:Polyamine aminopropyltransferase n=2 Tax=Aneurinibacillus aneurinilyticus TaxID=1391 RepID=U1YAD5_ANEAE|nr:polyamine aminopropyltransferase [Aneurinibacillus aneurinilyticus]ERI09102.1 spermidine synthase [Aneurinibacillus aneurinilyticus ATCC 12856]MCI1693319.1 polyamine aminopropyltransferase [Aneurinibacillus aneurinilyticus]MED0707496.1 polyamine aminopropyltransferase [Aneurinibacillus aneurinilyticus]MED0723864.1 polyamine aminopropyltransferase [Aneurinibacillus aneurinilyticus]MED0731802.1 polyamine aminopropyltransferase [Aneurinibacillus aneurinilyticus]